MLPPEHPDWPQRNLGKLLGSAFALANKALADALAAQRIPVSPDQFRLLDQLKSGGMMTQMQLSQRVGRDKANITRMIELLERIGLVARQPNPTDARSQLVHLTLEGDAVLLRAREAGAHALATITNHLSAEEKANLIAGLMALLR